MRKQLLISTAALLAGIGIASAQEMPAGKQSGGAQMEPAPLRKAANKVVAARRKS
jgi:hypothetical protein